MAKKYYILRFEAADAYHRQGQQILNSDAPLNIGQTEECDVRLPNESQYEDAFWGVIEKSKEEDAWKLIRVSPYQEHEIRVNGVPIDYVHYLTDGDIISFIGLRQELLFRIKEDDNYTFSGITLVDRGYPKWMIAILILLPLILFSFMFAYVESGRDKVRLTSEMMELAKKSVFQLCVDSVQLVSIMKETEDTVILGMCEYAVAGTCFLTEDSLIVTARHCIEPWLNIGDSLSLDTSRIEPLPVRWALQAETHNQECEETEWRVISFCTIMHRDSTLMRLCSLSSTDFKMNMERDDIIELGDYDHLYFWRSIAASRRTDMMLDDVAYARLPSDLLPPHGASLKMANRDEMKYLCNKANRPLIIVGFPDEEKVGVGDATCKEGSLLKRLDFSGKDGFPTSVLSHDGQINHGFSGGPVIMRHKDNCYVVGIVSVLDKKNNNSVYSVPVTEIQQMK